MSVLEELAVDHPYYCNTTNFYSLDAGNTWETMTEFLDEFEDSDIDYNLVFRWDVRPRGDDETSRVAGRYYAEVFIMGQRKGIFMPHVISHINEVEAVRFKSYLEKHRQRMLDLWVPLSVEVTTS